MAPVILLVDDQRDIVRLLHSALDTLRNPDLEIVEAMSGEAALRQIGDRQVDLLVTDYNLPGLTGTQLMKQARLTQPDLRAIVITANTDRKVREEILNSGAVAVFSKPVPLGDFLGAVERGLGAQAPPAPVEAEPSVAATPVSLPHLLDELRRDSGADAALLINRRGKVIVTSGSLRDTSMEVSLVATLTAYFMAALKVAETNRQQSPDHFSVFLGGDQDLIFMPVDPMHALVLAGSAVAAPETLADRHRFMQEMRGDLTRGLREWAGRKVAAAAPEAPKDERAAAPSADIESVLRSTDGTGLSDDEMDAYWDAAATQHGNKPLSKDVITYEEARKLGLTPDAEAKPEAD